MIKKLKRPELTAGRPQHSGISIKHFICIYRLIGKHFIRFHDYTLHLAPSTRVRGGGASGRKKKMYQKVISHKPLVRTVCGTVKRLRETRPCSAALEGSNLQRGSEFSACQNL